ncbi:MAG: PEP-CTERM sorting domain-containing protein [Rhodocyclaceae bacterium]
MNSFSKIAAGLALSVGLALPASAAVVQGIYFDENNTQEVDSGSFLQNLNTTTGELTGWGLVNSFNNNAIPITPGFELTYSFNSFVLDNAQSSLSRLVFTGGIVNIYSDNTPNFDIGNQATAEDSSFATPFLTLQGHLFLDIFGTGGTGTIGSNLISGMFMLDVVGGAAADYFDTNTIPDFLGGWADFLGNSSVVSYYPTGNVNDPSINAATFAAQVAATAGLAGISINDTSVDVLAFFRNNMGLDNVVATGSIDLRGEAQAVPEPTPVALISLGLIGLAFARRFRMK